MLLWLAGSNRAAEGKDAGNTAIGRTTDHAKEAKVEILGQDPYGSYAMANLR